MLQILLGKSQRTISEEILTRVCDNAARGIKGQILIVPEQYSHEMERRLCDRGGDTICLFAEVLSFSRLANRVCSLYGGVSRHALDHGGRLLAIAAALENIGPQLKLYGASRKKPEFLLRMLELIEELKGARVDVGTLRDASRSLEGQLAVKLEELALIQESYQAVCDTMGQDPHDRMEQLRTALARHAYASERSVFLLGFTDFTGCELGILTELMIQSESVCIGLLGAQAEGIGPFAVCKETLRRLRGCAADAGLKPELQWLPERPDVDCALAHLREQLFSGAALPWKEDAPEIALHHSSGVYGACMDAAGRIQALAMSGWRYRDIAVCCTQMDACWPVLEAVCERFSIPLYRSGVEAIEENPVIGMVLAALEAAAGGLEQEDVLRFLKSGLSPISQSSCDLLENYVRTWKIRGRKWESEWDMHPDGYGAAFDDAVRQTLIQINQSRVQGVGPLLVLRDQLRQAANTGEQVLAFYDFLERIALPQTLERLEEQCRSEAELRQAQTYSQIYEMLLGAMEQLYGVLGQTVRDPDDFYRMFGAVMSQYDVGTIPANLDSVYVGDPAAMRFGQTRAMLVLGADEGAYPTYQAELSLLSTTERKSLLTLGLEISPGEGLRMDRELTTIYQGLASCSERLYLNACSDQPSYLFGRVAALFPRCTVETDAQVPQVAYSSVQALGELFSANPELQRHFGDSGIDAVQKEARAIAAQAEHQVGVLSSDCVHRLYGRKLYLSASRIDRYAACRCAYFLNYGLKLKPQKEAAFDAPVYGTFVHAVLERTAGQVRAEGGFHQVGEERLLEIAREKIASYQDDTLALMRARSPRLAYLYQRNQEEVLNVVRELGRELRVSSFEPAGFEVEFSQLGQLPPVEIHGDTAEAEVSGFVDRVDLYTHNGVTYVRVVDYKTGKKAFDYTDVLNGIGLQMLIYLFALEERGSEAFGTPLKPAGVLYFPARRVILPAATKLTPEAAELKRQTEQTRKGLVADDAVVLQAMEQFEKTPVFMPFKVNAKGELVGDLAGMDEMRLLRHHVTRVLSRMTDDIAAGAVEPNPIVRGTENTACAYCEYAQVCHLASGEVRTRPMRKTDRTEFWEILRKEAPNV